MTSHFFDINTIINNNSKIWIVNKSNPNVPIFKISKSDFNLIKSGIYKSQGNKIEYNDNVYWMPTDIFNELKVKLKLHRISLSNIGISMQEFLNKDIIDNSNIDIDIDVIKSKLKNQTDDIYIICSKQVRHNYEKIISKIESKLEENGIMIKKFYFINDSINNIDIDDNRYKKSKLLLQHCVGYKVEGEKFINIDVDKYSIINFYDNHHDTVQIKNEINDVLCILLNKTDDGLKSSIKEDLSEDSHEININYITSNELNKIVSNKIILKYTKIIKKFENYLFFK